MTSQTIHERRLYYTRALRCITIYIYMYANVSLIRWAVLSSFGGSKPFGATSANGENKSQNDANCSACTQTYFNDNVYAARIRAGIKTNTHTSNNIYRQAFQYICQVIYRQRLMILGCGLVRDIVKQWLQQPRQIAWPTRGHPVIQDLHQIDDSYAIFESTAPIRASNRCTAMAQRRHGGAKGGNTKPNVSVVDEGTMNTYVHE